MEIRGKLLQKLPVESGVGSKGEWQRQTFVVETDDKFPRKVAIVA